MPQVQYLSRSLRDFLLGALGSFRVDPSRGHALLARVSVPNARSAKAHAYNSRYALMHMLMATVAAQGPGSNAHDLSLQAQAQAVHGGGSSAQVDGSSGQVDGSSVHDMLGFLMDMGFWQRAYAAGVCVCVGGGGEGGEQRPRTILVIVASGSTPRPSKVSVAPTHAMGILVDVSFRQRVFDTGVWGAVACVRVCVVCVCVCVCVCMRVRVCGWHSKKLGVFQGCAVTLALSLSPSQGQAAFSGPGLYLGHGVCLLFAARVVYGHGPAAPWAISCVCWT